MSTFRLLIDQDRCIACRACEAVCKAIHGNTPEISLGTLLIDGPRFDDAPEEATPIIVKHGKQEEHAGTTHRIVLHTRYRACVQCPNPRCVTACPRQALVQREADGIVFVRDADCVGCGLCVKACPHHLIWIDSARRKATKCDQCKDRIDDEQSPACVVVCPTQALKLVRKNEPAV